MSEQELHAVLAEHRPAIGRGTPGLRAAVALALVGVLAGWLGLSRAPAATATPARLIAAPTGPSATFARMPVPVRLRTGGLDRVRVTLNGREVTGRLGAKTRRARLRRSDGLRFGWNELYVTGKRRGRQVSHATSFVLVRRSQRLVRLRVRLDERLRSSVAITATSVPPLQAALSGAALRRRLAAIRRPRRFRAWLNGRPVAGHFDGARRSRWTARLSASHGLRYGRNMIRVRVVEPGRGLFADKRKVVRIPRDRPLASAGFDRSVVPRMRVRLDGRRSRPRRPGSTLHHRWLLVRRPKGSKAKLRRAHSARPLLVPDVAGAYRARLVVTEDRPGAAALRSGADTVQVTAAPQSPLVGFTSYFFNASSGRWAIKVGAAVYDNPSPNGQATQVLILPRDSLSDAPVNTYTTGDADATTGVGALKTRLSGLGVHQLVVIFNPPNMPRPPVVGSQVKAFNETMAVLGVEPIDGTLLQHPGQQFGVIGVPTSAAGSGWYSIAGHAGFLAKDTSGRFAFTPNRPVLDTSSTSGVLSNTMTIGAASATGRLTNFYSTGFHLVEIDPVEFTVETSNVYRACCSSDLQAMAARLRASNSMVAIQSIGPVQAPTDGDTDTQDAWGAVGQALERFGGTAHVFNNVSGSYAFVGGPYMDHRDAVEASAGIVTDPTTSPPSTMTGRIRGRAAPSHLGGYVPVVWDTRDKLTLGLSDLLLTEPVAWPDTDGKPIAQTGCGPPGDDTAPYVAAMAWFTEQLGLSSYGDLRTAYTEADTIVWSDKRQDLKGLTYSDNPAPTYTQAQFCNLQAQLLQEMEWVDGTMTLFGSYKEPWDRTQMATYVDLQTIGTDIKNSLRPPNSSVEMEVFDVLSEAIGLLSFIPEKTLTQMAIGGLGSVFSLANDFSPGGSPVGDAIDAKVSELSQKVATYYANASATMDNLRDIAISDWGRLKAIGPLATDADWVLNTDNINQIVQSLQTSAKRSFYGELMPLAYRPAVLEPSSRNRYPSPGNCLVRAGPTTLGPGAVFESAPASGSMGFQQVPGAPTDGSGPGAEWWVLHSTTDYFPTEVPDLPRASLTDPLVTPLSQNGLGLYLPWFLKRQFGSNAAPATCVDTKR